MDTDHNNTEFWMYLPVIVIEFFSKTPPSFFDTSDYIFVRISKFFMKLFQLKRIIVFYVQVDPVEKSYPLGAVNRFELL